MVTEQWRKRFRIGGQVLFYVLIVGYLLVILVDLSSLRSNISSMAGDISSLQSDVNSIQSDVSSIQNDVSAIADDLDDLNNESGSDTGKSASSHPIRAHVPRLAAWTHDRRANLKAASLVARNRENGRRR